MTASLWLLLVLMAAAPFAAALVGWRMGRGAASVRWARREREHVERYAGHAVSASGTPAAARAINAGLRWPGR